MFNKIRSSKSARWQFTAVIVGIVTAGGGHSNAQSSKEEDRQQKLWAACLEMDADKLSSCTELIGLTKSTQGLKLLYRSRAFIYQELKDYDNAISDYSEGIKLDQNDPYALMKRAECYKAKRDYDRAILDHNGAIKIAPNSSKYGSRAAIYKLKGQFDRAIEDLTKAIALTNRADSSQYLLARGNLHHDKGDFNRAIADYDQAHRLDPDYYLPLHNRSNSKRAKGDLVGADADLAMSQKLRTKGN